MPFTDPCTEGDTWIVTFRGSLFNQLIMNTFHYRVAYLATPGTTNAKQGVLYGLMNGAGGMVTKYLACLPDQYVLTRVDIQKIGPYRTVANQTTEGSSGTNGLDALRSNSAYSIERRSELARRFDIGRVQIPATDDSAWTNNGQVQIAALNALQAFAPYLYNPQGTLGATDTFQPVLSRIGGGVRINTDLLQATVQSTVRTMRRRTVGVGK
jgi:hypothetical protein